METPLTPEEIKEIKEEQEFADLGIEDYLAQILKEENAED